MNRIAGNPAPRDPSPLQTARAVLARGRSLGSEVEVFVQHGRTVNVKVFDREIESVTVAEPRGLGIRAVHDGRMGYSFTADLSPAGIDRALAAAVDNLRAADVDPFMRLPEPAPGGYPKIPGLWLPGIAKTSLENKTRIALEAEAAALANPEITVVEESVYADEESHIAVASSTGIEAEAEQSFCFTYVAALAGRNGERQSGLGFSTGREPALLDPERAGREAAERARALLGARPCETGSYTVVLDPEVAAALLASIWPL